MTDPIADMFIRIKNAQAVNKDTVLVPYSKFKMEIAKLLLANGFIKNIIRKGKKTKKHIEIQLLYDKDNKGKIEEIRRVSRPSKRVYAGYRDINPIRQGRGLAFISTPGGIITDKEARKKKAGGEIIGKIW